MMHLSHLFPLLLALMPGTCQQATGSSNTPAAQAAPLAENAPATPPAQPEKKKPERLEKDDIRLDTALLFDRYTLPDHYRYEKTERQFNWENIRIALALIENMQDDRRPWGVVQNYKNRNREAPLVKTFSRNKYGRVADSLGVERYQSAPLYTEGDTLRPTRYGRDGSLYHVCGQTAGFYLIEHVRDHQRWYIPRRYLSLLPDSARFHHVIVVDRRNQNITTLERKERGHWLIRSKNPATTGRNKPPYAQPTPLGIFLVQEQKSRMVYLKDGSSERAGFAPYASRFTNGAYLHGVPVKAPRTALIEYSWSLGTVPRSHMCVRNATSHAKFIYDWAPLRQSLVVVIE